MLRPPPPSLSPAVVSKPGRASSGRLSVARHGSSFRLIDRPEPAITKMSHPGQWGNKGSAPFSVIGSPTVVHCWRRPCVVKTNGCFVSTVGISIPEPSNWRLKCCTRNNYDYTACWQEMDRTCHNSGVHDDLKKFCMVKMSFSDGFLREWTLGKSIEPHKYYMFKIHGRHKKVTVLKNVWAWVLPCTHPPHSTCYVLNLITLQGFVSEKLGRISFHLHHICIQTKVD